MKILKQFEARIPTDPIKKLAVLKKMCYKQRTCISKGCGSCLANFGSKAPGQCSLRRQEPDRRACCDIPTDWRVPDISTKYSEEDIKSIIAWFKDLMIYHPDKFGDLRKYIDKWGCYV